MAKRGGPKTRNSTRRNAPTRPAARPVASVSRNRRKVSRRSPEISGPSPLVPRTSEHEADSLLCVTEEDITFSQLPESQIAGPSNLGQSEEPITPPPNTPPIDGANELNPSAPFKTPNNRPSVQKNNTPFKFSLCNDPEMASGFCDAQREAIMNNLGRYIPQVTNKYLFENLLPPLPQNLNLEDLCEKLKSNSNLVDLGEGEWKWAAFDCELKKEADFFNRALTDVFNALIIAVDGSLSETTSTVEFRPEGNHAFQPGDLKPDGALFLRDPSEEAIKNPSEKKDYKRLWSNTAVAFAFKRNKGTGDKYENTKQVVHSMQHVMAVDPCRRFTYGIQIDRTIMRVWFRSRSSIFISDELDLNKDYGSVARIFVSLLYASKSDLGWDPTISTETIDGERIHTIDVSGTQVVTDATMNISDSKAQNIIGSGTRIYLAKRIVDGKEAEEVVLKDVWLEDGRIPEHEIRAQIVNDISDADDQEYVREHILTPIAYGKVKVGNTEDHTERVMLRGKSPDYSRKYEIETPAEKVKNKEKTGVHHENKEVIEHTRQTHQVRKDNERNYYPHRYHYRVLYKEVATPFYNLRNSMDIILVSIDVLETLRRIHEAGWVHRDISGGNIYLYIDPITNRKRGMIGDLEFAKRAGVGARYDVRTGTPDFMAIEIAEQDYLFRSNQKGRPIRTGGRFDVNARMRAKRAKCKELELDTEDDGGIFYNYIHDVESVWWALVWALFSFEKKDELLDLGNVVTRRTNRKYLFSGVLDSAKRQNFIKNIGTYDRYMKCIPGYFKDFGSALDLVREMIVEEYEVKEVDDPQSIKYELPELHAQFISFLRVVAMDDFEIVRISSDKIEKTASKRATVGDDEGHSSKRQKCSQSHI